MDENGPANLQPKYLWQYVARTILTLCKDGIQNNDIIKGSLKAGAMKLKAKQAKQLVAFGKLAVEIANGIAGFFDTFSF